MKSAEHADGQNDGNANHKGSQYTLPCHERSTCVPPIENDVRQKRQKHHDDKDARSSQEQEKPTEIPVVPETYAVVDPRTVVVHFQDTPPAHSAVMRSGRLEPLALPALPWSRAAKLLCLRGQLLSNLLKLRRQSWVHKRSVAVVVERIGEQEDAYGRNAAFRNQAQFLDQRERKVEIGERRKAYQTHGSQHQQRTQNLHAYIEADSGAVDDVIDNSDDVAQSTAHCYLDDTWRWSILFRLLLRAKHLGMRNTIVPPSGPANEPLPAASME